MKAHYYISSALECWQQMAPEQQGGIDSSNESWNVWALPLSVLLCLRSLSAFLVPVLRCDFKSVCFEFFFVHRVSWFWILPNDPICVCRYWTKHLPSNDLIACKQSRTSYFFVLLNSDFLWTFSYSCWWYFFDCAV